MTSNTTNQATSPNARRATRRHRTSPVAAAATEPPTMTGNALDAAEAAFRLLVTGPSPLALDGASLGHGLPSRSIDLSEMKGILFGGGATEDLRDAVWAELVHRSRTDGPAWVVGCVGVARPALVTIAARAIRTAPASLTDDIVSELVTEFVAQLARIDTTRPAIGERLLLWARKAAVRVRARQQTHQGLDPAITTTVPAASPATDAEAAALLADAVRQKVISTSTGALINATRLEGLSLTEYARIVGEPEKRLTKRRSRAEARLAAAIADGQVSAISAADLSPTSP
jgi:hypothetical protein